MWQNGYFGKNFTFPKVLAIILFKNLRNAKKQSNLFIVRYTIFLTFPKSLGQKLGLENDIVIVLEIEFQSFE